MFTVPNLATLVHTYRHAKTLFICRRVTKRKLSSFLCFYS